MTLRELTEEIGVAPRQVRYMIAEGFVPPPSGGRTHASYGAEHVAAITRYLRLRELGFTPASIRVLLQAREGVPFPVAPGITLVVEPKLVASGEPVQPLSRRIEALLGEILDKHGGIE